MCLLTASSMEMKSHVCVGLHKGCAMNTIYLQIGVDSTIGIFRREVIFSLVSTCQKWKHFSKLPT